MELTPIIADTDFISDYLVGKEKTKNNMKELLMSHQIIISTSITVGELYFGKNRRNWQEKRTKSLDKFISLLNIVSFEKQHAIEYGKLRANLIDKGEDIGFTDTANAAIAKIENIPILTGNINHFNRIEGLQVEEYK